ncbi:MAG: extracellular solute-binding protein [Patescibacteria group bacterium]
MDKLKLKVIIGIAVVVIVVGGGIIYGIFFAKKDYKATLNMWVVFGSSADYDDAVSAFGKLHKGVKINITPKNPSTYEQELVEALASNTGPDIMMVHNSWLPKYKSILTSLPATISTKYSFGLREYQSELVDVATQDFVDSEQIYAMPLAVDTMQLYWNKDLFNTAGITYPPRTWDEVVQNAPRLTIKDAQKNITQSAISLGSADNINRASDILSLLMLQTGTQMVDDKKTRATFQSGVQKNGKDYNPAEAALSFYASFADPASPNYSWNSGMNYSTNVFTQGRLAMMLNYAYNFNKIKKDNPRLNFSISPLPQTSDASKNITFANYWAYGVANSSANFEAAWDFLMFFSGLGSGGDKAYVSDYLEKTFQFPARRDLVNDFRKDPLSGVFADGVLQATGWYRADPNGIEDVFLNMIRSVAGGSQSATKAIQQASAQVTNLMRK